MKAEAYQQFKDKQSAPMHLPDFTADSVLDINFETLRDIGVKHVLFDLDLTIRRPRAKEIEADIITYLVGLHEQGVFQSLSLATNNISPNLDRFSQPLGARVFQPFYRKGRIIRKPNEQFFKKILTALKADPREVVMIGDKAMFDVAGGNRVGMHTVLVKPHGKDLLHDRLLFIRFREKRLLKAARALAEEVQEQETKATAKK